jgi:hypothetical protein
VVEPIISIITTVPLLFLLAKIQSNLFPYRKVLLILFYNILPWGISEIENNFVYVFLKTMRTRRTYFS